MMITTCLMGNAPVPRPFPVWPPPPPPPPPPLPPPLQPGTSAEARSASAPNDRVQHRTVFPLICRGSFLRNARTERRNEADQAANPGGDGISSAGVRSESCNGWKERTLIEYP